MTCSPLSVSRKRQARTDIFATKLRKILKNLIFGHSAGQVREHITHRDARTPDSRPTEADLRINDNVFAVFHIRTLPGWLCTVKISPQPFAIRRPTTKFSDHGELARRLRMQAP